MHKPIYYFGMMMAVVYIIVGIFILLLGSKYMTNMPGWFPTAFGIMLLLYGGFRLSRLISSARAEKAAEERDAHRDELKAQREKLFQDSKSQDNANQ